MALEFNNYRGIRDLVIAPLTIQNGGDGSITESYGTVQPLSGVQ